MREVQISGNITADAEKKAIGDRFVINFAIANNDESKKMENGSYESIVSFFNVVFWSKSGKMANHLKKGKTVSIVGKLKQDRWEKDGKTFQAVKIQASEVIPHVYEKVVDTCEVPEPTPTGDGQVSDGDVPF